MKQLRNFVPALAVSAAALLASASHAAISVTPITTALDDAGPAITIVAGAVLAIIALVVCFKLIRRAM